MPRQALRIAAAVRSAHRHGGGQAISAFTAQPLQNSIRPAALNESQLEQSMDDLQTTGLQDHNRPPFQPRKTFSLPMNVPSWYAGHMYRAMRSLPALLARQPPPLIIETRDARLPISSINPAFEDMLLQMEGNAGKGKAKRECKSTENDDIMQSDDLDNLHDVREWRRRRLIVYNKADLIDPRLYQPIRDAFAKYDGLGHADVMFVDSRKDSDVRKVMKWVRTRAAMLAQGTTVPASSNTVALSNADEETTTNASISPSSMPRSARKQNLSGAFRHTSTPEDGVRLIIVGMPNVGKSSLLNALRRVGTGLGKAASTAPEPGHTRKLTGTVRITKKLPNDTNHVAKTTDKVNATQTDGNAPAIYVYDTPGVMVPFLGNGLHGAEKGVKLAVASGIKSSLFDSIGLADYLLFRLNLKWAAQWQIWRRRQDSQADEPLPAYITGLPLSMVRNADVVGQEQEAKPTNEIHALLHRLALRAPGTLSKNGERDIDASAKFMLDRWRIGRLTLTNEGACDSGELDTGAYEWSPTYANSAWNEDEVRACVEQAVRRHFAQTQRARQQGVATSFRPVKGADRASRRALEKIDWTTLRATADAEEKQKYEAKRSKEEAAAVPSSLLSKRQEKSRKRALELAIRQNRLRQRGVRVDGLMRKQKGKSKGTSPSASTTLMQKTKPARRDDQAALRVRRRLAARAGRKMSGH